LDIFQWVPKIADDFLRFQRVTESVEARSTKNQLEAYKLTGNTVKLDEDTFLSLQHFWMSGGKRLMPS